TDIDVYRMDAQGHLQVAIQARQGQLDASGMVLQSPQVTYISVDGTRVAHPERMQVDIKLGSDVLALAAVDPDEQSSHELLRYIDYLEANDLNADDYKLALWRNIVTPFTIWLLAVFALPFAFGSLRSAGAGQRLFLGGLFGLVFYLVN